MPRVALEELNPDLEFEVMGEDDYGASAHADHMRSQQAHVRAPHVAMSDDDDDDDD